MSISQIEKRVVRVVIFLAACITFYSCKYDKIENKPCNTSVPEVVSFKGNILPMFRADCSTSGCHSGTSPGGHLNLEDSLAYSQLSRSGTGYIDTINPTFSILYTQMISTNRPMPPSGELDDCTIELVLKWIQQKAPNN